MKMETKEYRLGELAQFSNGINFDKNAYFGSGIRLITVSDFGNNFSPDYESLIEVSNEVVKDKDLILKNDILFVRSNGNKELVGRCMLIDNVDKPTTYSGFCIKCHFDNENVSDPKYFTYYFKNQYFRKCISNASGGTNIQNLNQEILSKHKLQLPPLRTQQKIASILSAYDNLIQNYKKQIQALQTAASELYKEWFVRFRFPGYQTAEFENGIPEGWKVERLTKLVGIKYGKDHSKLDDGNIPVYGSGGIMRYCNKALYDKETVLIPRKGSLNNIMYANRPLWTVDTMFYSIMLRKNFAKYLYYVLSKIDMESFNAGAALPSMTTEILSHFKIIVPDNKTLELFDNKIALIFIQIDNLQQQITNLTQQRDLLLPRLMSGKLEVE